MAAKKALKNELIGEEAEAKVKPKTVRKKAVTKKTASTAVKKTKVTAEKPEKTSAKATAKKPKAPIKKKTVKKATDGLTAKKPAAKDMPKTVDEEADDEEVEIKINVPHQVIRQAIEGNSSQPTAPAPQSASEVSTPAAPAPIAPADPATPAVPASPVQPAPAIATPSPSISGVTVKGPAIAPAPQPVAPAAPVQPSSGIEGVKIPAKTSIDQVVSFTERLERKRSSEAVASGVTAVNEPKPVPAESDKKIRTSRPLGLYRKMAFLFGFLTVVLVLAVFYFTFAKVTITLIPNQERLSQNLLFDVYDKDEQPVGGNSVEGIVREIPVQVEGEYEATDKEVIGEETVGKVVISNNYIKSQPLMASTRLVTPDNKMFRLKNTVNIPAGGEIEVEVYADKPSQEMAIAPTTFTIPGLWAGLQDKIFGKSEEAFVFQQKVKKKISQSDLDNAVKDLKQSLLTSAKEQVNQDYKDYDQIIFSVNEDSIESEEDAKAGEEKDNFKAKLSGKVAVVAFNEAKTAELAQQKFISSLDASKDLVDFNKENIIYALDKYDTDKGYATVNATFDGKVSLKENSEIIEVKKILGLNQDELDAFLSSMPDIAGYEVSYFPSFIKRVPNLADKVIVEIKR